MPGLAISMKASGDLNVHDLHMPLGSSDRCCESYPNHSFKLKSDFGPQLEDKRYFVLAGTKSCRRQDAPPMPLSNDLKT